MERMAKWKITRESFGDEEFTFNENEQITIGRSPINKIVLSSTIVSVNHCVINVYKDHLVISDLKSSNGTFINNRKLTPYETCIIKDSDTIGIGWTIGFASKNFDDSEKYVFKLTKEGSLSDIQSQDEVNGSEMIPSPQLASGSKISIKRNKDKEQIICIKCRNKVILHEDIISILSDSDNDTIAIEPITQKVIEGDQSIKNEVSDKVIEQAPVKIDSSDNDELFNLKQQYLEFDEPIETDSYNSDSHFEQWVTAYSQLHDTDGSFSDEKEVEDSTSIPPPEPETSDGPNENTEDNDDEVEFSDYLIQIDSE